MSIDGQWYRVFYRGNKSESVRGDEELAKRLQRKSPIVVHHEIAMMHVCDSCGCEGPWDKEWMALPRRDEDGKWTGQKYCSKACWIDKTGGHDLPGWIDTNHEPDRDRERMQAFWAANHQDSIRKREAIAYRSVPLPPDWKGTGWCRWCTKEIIEKGKRSKRRNWHPDCLIQFNLHSALWPQYRHCRDRDGQQCAWLGCEETDDLEVDHKIPLWSVRDLPDDERRHYYGPDNLWLLCKDHHKAKTKREAGQRAEAAKLEKAQIALPL